MNKQLALKIINNTIIIRIINKLWTKINHKFKMKDSNNNKFFIKLEQKENWTIL